MTVTCLFCLREKIINVIIIKRNEVIKMFVYKIDVLKELKQKGYNTTRLRKEKLLGENAIQSLRHGEMVGIIALDKICTLLDSEVDEIIKHEKD